MSPSLIYRIPRVPCPQCEVIVAPAVVSNTSLKDTFKISAILSTVFFPLRYAIIFVSFLV